MGSYFHMLSPQVTNVSISSRPPTPEKDKCSGENDIRQTVNVLKPNPLFSEKSYMVIA